MTTIIIIFACVVVVAIYAYWLRLLADGARLRLLMHRRRVEDVEREVMMREPWPPPNDNEDDETKTLPHLGIGA